MFNAGRFQKGQTPWNKGLHITLKPKRGKNLSCLICRKKFYVEQSDIKKRKTCSYKCAGELKKKKKIKLVCKNCKKSFLIYPSAKKWHQIRNYKYDFCSQKCSWEFHRETNSPNWIQDRTKLKCRPLRNLKTKQWSKSVFERDNYTCKLCGKWGGKLQPHHIKRWHDYPELRYEINNGITLCYDCHLLTRGKEKQFEEQFINYIKSRR